MKGWLPFLLSPTDYEPKSVTAFFFDPERNINPILGNTLNLNRAIILMSFFLLQICYAEELKHNFFFVTITKVVNNRLIHGKYFSVPSHSIPSQGNLYLSHPIPPHGITIVELIWNFILKS